MKEDKKLKIKPFVKWAGGKRGIMEKLMSHIPKEFNNYYEPFLGGGALFFNIKEQCKNCFISDINKELITSYEVIRDNIVFLFNELEKHKENHNKEYYLKIRSQHHLENKIDIAARFIYLNKTCFNGLYKVNLKGEFNVAFGSYKEPNILDVQNLKACHEYLQTIDISCIDFNQIKPKENDFVYFDPPYYPVDNNNRIKYNKTGFTEEDQIRLSNFIKELTKKGVKTLLSNSLNDFIKDLYSSNEFNIIEIEAPRLISSKSSGRKPVTELLIKNYKE